MRALADRANLCRFQFLLLHHHHHPSDHQNHNHQQQLPYSPLLKNTRSIGFPALSLRF